MARMDWWCSLCVYGGESLEYTAATDGFAGAPSRGAESGKQKGVDICVDRCTPQASSLPHVCIGRSSLVLIVVGIRVE